MMKYLLFFLMLFSVGYADTVSSNYIFKNSVTINELTVTGNERVLKGLKVGNASGITGVGDINIAGVMKVNGVTQNFSTTFNGDLLGQTLTNSLGNITANKDIILASNGVYGVTKLSFADDGKHNTRLGYEAGLTINSSANDNVYIGYRAGGNATEGDSNVIIGSDAGLKMTTGKQNVMLGAAVSSTGTGLTTGFNNVLIGYAAMANGGGTNNVIIGHSAGALQAGNNNVLLGSNANVQVGTDHDKLIIANATWSDRTPLIQGDFANLVTTFNGKVVATSFVGDGSGITGLSATTTTSFTQITVNGTTSTNALFVSNASNIRGPLTIAYTGTAINLSANNSNLLINSGNIKITGGIFLTGNLTVNGNGDFTGTITANNIVNNRDAYGQYYVTYNALTFVPTNVYTTYNVNIIFDVTKNMTYENGVFTIQNTDMYRLNYSGCLEKETDGDDIEGGFSVNGAEPIPLSEFKADATLAGFNSIGGKSFIYPLNAGDKVCFKMKNISSNTKYIILRNFVVLIARR